MNSSHILSNKISENKPRYIICNSFSKNINSIAFKEVKYYLDLGYKPEEMFILAPSVKSLSSPVRTLENLIKTELKELIEQERDLTILKAIKALLKKTTLDTTLREKLTQRAIRSEEDIKDGRVLSRSEIIKKTDKLIQK